jgi:hypothetical protein
MTLIEILEQIFGTGVFMSIDVMDRIETYPIDEELLAAVEAEIPHARYKSGGAKGSFNPEAIQRGISRLKGNGVIVPTRHRLQLECTGN